MLKNKKILVSLSAIILAILLTATTFAWQTMLNKVNEFIGKKTEITIHDDFDPDAGVKDVFIENPGKREIFVRIKLNEFMDLTKNTAPANPNWLAHKYGKTFPIDCGGQNAAGEYFHDYFTWTMGGKKYYMPAASGGVVSDLHNYTGTEPGVKETPNASMITVGDYLNLTSQQRATYTGWICDLQDGYAYWSQPLGEGKVTGLLLHGVTTNPVLKDREYYYAIDVIVEAVDLDDLPMWTVPSGFGDGKGVPSVDNSGTQYSEASASAKQALQMIATLVTP